MSQEKPKKKTDKELWELIPQKIVKCEYIISKHARTRQKDRNILDVDVLDILENKPGRKRKRNKSKDIYTNGYEDWNYCIEGCDLEGEKIRLVISFDEKLMLVITVIRLNNPE